MSVKNKARDRLPGGRLKSYRRVGSHFASCARWFDKSPSWYRNMMMTRPERREVRRLLNQVMRGHDADALLFRSVIVRLFIGGEFRTHEISRINTRQKIVNCLF